ncbi:MAG TPA: endonuclease/exonuclease/phosphatase family protein [Pseudonocardiaceae bacterium]
MTTDLPTTAPTTTRAPAADTAPAEPAGPAGPAGPHPARGGRRRWCLGTRLLVAATAAWVVFLGLHVLLAGRWWPWLVVEAMPTLTVVVVPALLLLVVPLARPVRRWLSVVLVALLLAGVRLAGFGTGSPGAEATGPPGTEVSVFTWSADYWEMTDDPDAFYAFLREQDADVYLLQEYLHWEGDGPIRIDRTDRLRAEFPGYQVIVDGELLTLSRLPVVSAHHRPVPTTGTDWYWNGPKSQRTDLLVGGRTVSFYNVHLPVPFRIGDHPLSGRFYRFLEGQGTWRLRELRALRADLAGNPNPAVVAGDFNSPWMELTSLGAGAEAHNPTDGVLPARSWPVSDYPFPRLWRLDWLFTTGGLAVPGYRFGGGESFSDHFAQHIRVVVPE